MAGGMATAMGIQITVNGDPIEGLLHASFFTANSFSSDSYSLTFAMGLPPLGDITYWSSLSSLYVEIDITTADGLSSQSLLSGMIDTVLLDPIQGTASIEGRDLSSTMIDAYRQQDFVNQTASEVVSTIATYHGLTPMVTATSGWVGRYFGDGYTRLSLGQFSRLRSDWDLLVQLARESSFDVFVQGATLFFQPSGPLNAIPVQLVLDDLKTLRFEQTLAIASNPIARVQSWNSQSMASYESSSPGDGVGSAQDNSKAGNRPFLFSAPNFTSQQVTDSAGRYALELSRLGTVLHAEMPWDLNLSPRTMIAIYGTASAFDTTYQIDSVERYYSTTSGSTQTIRAIIV